MASVSNRSEVSTVGTKVYRFVKSASDAGSVRSHDFEYDVYIFYDLEDHDFVSKHIIQNLDSDYSGNYKCCYEVKDFLPGFYYDECIRRALKESYWTFLVFSHTSVSKGYTNFLYHQAVYTTGARRFLPIKIDDCEIPEVLEDVKIELDFTVMPPEEFKRRLVAVVSEATCLFPDPKRPALGENRTKKQNLSRLPHAKSSQSQTLDNYSIDELPISSVPNRRPIEQVPAETSRNQGHIQKWSVAAFHDNPDLYIDNFNHTNSSSSIFHKFEHTLLANILPRVVDHGCVSTVTSACLVLLTCCPSPLVKRRALHLLENRLIADDLCTDTSANGLVETEELLRESLLGRPFQTETSNFQCKRLKVYAKLLFSVAMHIEKRHLAFDLFREQNVYQVDALVSGLLKQIHKVSLSMAYAFFMVRYAHDYLANLVENVMLGTISNCIEELKKMTNSQLYLPWTDLESSLKEENYWVYLDIMISYVGNQVFKNPSFLHVLLRHVPLLLRDYPKVRLQVRCGVLLNVAQMLADLISRHERRDIRMSAMFGVKTSYDCLGLTSLWTSELYAIDEFQQDLKDLVYPLLLTAHDIEVRQVIYKIFFESTYQKLIIQQSMDTSDQLCTTEEDKVVELIKKHLTSNYEQVGDCLEFLSPIHRRTNNHILEASFNYTTSVVVKIPRMKGLISLVDPEAKSTDTEMLQNELSILSDLSHKHIVKLICQPNVDRTPIHAMIEQLDGGNLQSYLHQARDVYGPMAVSRLDLLQHCIQIGEALAYLCSKGVVHRDICAYNVLLKNCSNGCSVKLAGFSLAQQVSPNARLEYATGTSVEDNVLLRWSDPESLFKGVWSMATDMWMFWCLVFEVFTYGAHPFPECLTSVDVPIMIERGYCLRQPLCMPSDLHLLIQQGLLRNPAQHRMITKFLTSLRELQQDWVHATHRKEPSGHKANFNMKYPDCPWKAMKRMTPREFQEKHQVKSTKQPGVPTSNRCVEFKQLHSPDIVDSSEVDQPYDCVQFSAGKAVHINIEVFTAQQEKLEVIETLRQLESVNVCRILNFHSPPGTKAILMTEMDIGGNVLEAVLHNPANFTVEHVVKFMLQVLEGLQQLHIRYHLVHTDLRAQYMYAGAVIPGLDKGYFRVKLGRLSRCKLLYKSSLDCEGRTTDSDPVPIDSLRWAPPEVLLAPAYYSRGSDIYSLGLVFWQLLYALQAVEQPDYRLVVPHPDWRLDRVEFHRKLMLGRHPEQPAHCPDWAYILIKKCLRSRYKRPTIDILQETLTHREPFKSTLLKGVRQQLSHSIYKPNINYNEQQAEGAPYLREYQEPLTSDSEPSCLNPRFEEPDHFYLYHARFGYQNEDDSENCLLTVSNKEYEEDYEIYEYWDIYNDVKSPYEQPALGDQIVGKIQDSRLKSLGYQNVSFGGKENLEAKAMGYANVSFDGRRNSHSSETASANGNGGRYQNVALSGRNAKEECRDIDGTPNSNDRGQSEDVQSKPPMPTVRSIPTSQMMSFTQEAIIHTKMYRPPSAATISRSVSFIHNNMNDKDSYSHVTKHFLQYPQESLEDGQSSGADTDCSSMV